MQTNIGTNIRKWRTLKGFKQIDFALQIGVSKPTLSKIENNRQSISVLRLQQIAICLKINVVQLYFDPSDLIPPREIK